ncbi:hypothetical protein GmHk_17G048851 [Glycine max]|nr:hypothetical protein GmHk_17G048851 [Glycine max]
MSVFRCTHTTEKDNYESFQEFFECWMFEQNQHLKELVAAESTTHLTDEKLQALNGKVVEHYEQYYNAKLCKARCVGHVLSNMAKLIGKGFSLDWWMKTQHGISLDFSLQFEARLDELIRGRRTHDLGDISASQLSH